MLMKQLFTSLTLLTVITTVHAQTLAVYEDYRNYFYAFDDGITTQLEYMPVLSYKVGGSCIAYIDTKGSFKIYHNGRKFTLEKYNVNRYFATQHIVVYTLESQLIVFDGERRKSLMFFPSYYAFGDSIVAYYDKPTEYLKVFYQGNVTELEDGLAGRPVKSMIVGDNILAYVNQSDLLKIFYRNRVIEVAYSPISFRVGRNVVAYIDGSTSEFKMFYNGETYDLEMYRPISYKAGDDIVAYVDESGSFKAFYNGELITINTFEPEFYYLKDNMLVYSEDNFLKVFYEGNSYTLENYIPDKYYTALNVVAYIDQEEKLKGFYNGEVKTLSYEKISKIELSGNAVSFTIGVNTNKVFYKGHIYKL